MVITEIGGTVGDIESLPFLEAIRQFRQEVGRDNALFIHLTLVPYIAAAGELKTKPTQHSVRELMQIGIQPDILICRSEQAISADIKRKIALFCNVDFDCVIESPDVNSIYEIPLRFHDQGLDRVVCERLRLETKEPDLARLEGDRGPADPAPGAQGAHRGGRQVHRAARRLQVGPGGPDSRRHRQRRRVEIEWIASDRFTDQEAAGKRCSAASTACWSPAASASAASEGMVEAVRWARENDLPFFGICLGLQVAIIEFARNVCRLPDTNSTEFAPDCETPVISLHAVAARGVRPGRHHAARRVHRAAPRPAPARRRRTAPPRSASVTATAGRSTTPTATCSRSTASGSRASRPTAGWSR